MDQSKLLGRLGYFRAEADRIGTERKGPQEVTPKDWLGFRDLLDEAIVAIKSAAAVPGDPAFDVVSEILLERRRQVDVEGHLAADDDGYQFGELACAAAKYALAAPHIEVDKRAYSMLWPWEMDTFKPGRHRANLIKAAALLLAEIEREDRMPF